MPQDLEMHEEQDMNEGNSEDRVWMDYEEQWEIPADITLLEVYLWIIDEDVFNLIVW